MLAPRNCLTILLVASAIWMPPDEGESATVVETLIAAQNPCGGLKTSTPLGQIGVDKLKNVRVPEVDVSLRDNLVTISLQGSLACKTSDKAVFRGDASAKLAGSIGVDLGTCEFLDVTISLSEFGGKFGQAIAAFSDQIETTLQEEARKAIGQACKALLSGEE